MIVDGDVVLQILNVGYRSLIVRHCTAHWAVAKTTTTGRESVVSVVMMAMSWQIQVHSRSSAAPGIQRGCLMDRGPNATVSVNNNCSSHFSYTSAAVAHHINLKANI